MPKRVRRFVAGTTTAVAPVAAIPTTAAHFALWNGEPEGGKVYNVLTCAWTTIVSAGVAFVGTLLAHYGGPVGVPTGTLAQGPKALDGLGAGSRAQALSAVTIVAGTGMWHPIESSVNAGAATAGIALGDWQNVDGIYQLRPGGMLSLAVFCNSAGSATCAIYVTWEEEPQ